MELAFEKEVIDRCFPDVLAYALGRRHGRRIVEMLVMFHYEERTYEEIAIFHKSDRGTVMRTIRNANEALKFMGLWNPGWKEVHRSVGRRKTVTMSSGLARAEFGTASEEDGD